MNSECILLYMVFIHCKKCWVRLSLNKESMFTPELRVKKIKRLEYWRTVKGLIDTVTFTFTVKRLIETDFGHPMSYGSLISALSTNLKSLNTSLHFITFVTVLVVQQEEGWWEVFPDINFSCSCVWYLSLCNRGGRSLNINVQKNSFLRSELLFCPRTLLSLVLCNTRDGKAYKIAQMNTLQKNITKRVFWNVSICAKTA